MVWFAGMSPGLVEQHLNGDVVLVLQPQHDLQSAVHPRLRLCGFSGCHRRHTPARCSIPAPASQMPSARSLEHVVSGSGSTGAHLDFRHRFCPGLSLAVPAKVEGFALLLDRVAVLHEYLACRVWGDWVKGLALVLDPVAVLRESLACRVWGLGSIVLDGGALLHNKSALWGS